MPPADVIQDRRVTVLVQGLAPALSDGSRLSWATPSSLHEGLGCRAVAPDRIQGDAVLPRFDKAQSRITSARPRRRSLCPEGSSLAPCSPPSSPLRAASGGDLRSDLTAAARGASPFPRSGRRNALCPNKETVEFQPGESTERVMRRCRRRGRFRPRRRLCVACAGSLWLCRF